MEKWKILDNEPCGADLFEGQTQKNVAKTICDVLQEKECCQIICIDGGLGSGKSNLVKIVENDIETTTSGSKKMLRK